jgi:hypothetical protein
MGSYYYTLFAIFTIISVMIVVDPNVGRYITLLISILGIRYEKTKWWLLHNPSNPIVKYMMWRRAWKMAEEFRKEFGKDSE